MRTIGITGGVGSGKSTILSYIEVRYNARVIRADEAAHGLEAPGQSCYQPLVELLGKEILCRDGTIDREKMAQKIFREEGLLAAVNQIVHPAVKVYILEEMEKERKRGCYDFFFLEAALLIEEHYDTILDELWYIDSGEDIRRTRLKESRGYSDEKITNMIKKQMPEEIFRRTCRLVIDNSGSLEDAYRQIDYKLGEIL